MNCESYQDRTGDYVCNRCGYQWDKDDTPPECKTEHEILSASNDKQDDK